MNAPFRLTIVLALILSGLGAYVYFVDVPQTQKTLKRERQATRLTPFDDLSITHMTITTSEEQIVLIRDKKLRWHITEPLVAPADSREVKKILRALTIGKITRTIKSDEKNQGQYGLSPPRMTLTITAGGVSEEIALGNRAPLSSTLYARKRPDNQIILTTLDPLTFANKSLYTFRNKDVLAFDITQTEEIRLDRGDEELILYRQPGAHGLSPNWSFRSPIKGPADRTTVGLLLRNLRELQAKDFVDSPSEKEKLLSTLGSPRVTATIYLRQRGHTVSFYRSANLPDAYAMTKKGNPLYRIAPDILSDLTKGLFNLRDKRLLGMETREIAILTVRTPTESYTLINQSGQWVLEDEDTQNLNQEVIRLFASRVVDLPAEFRVSKNETAVGQYGLESPAVEIKATDLRGNERGYIALGQSGKGLVYAMGAGLPGIHQARSNILTQIPSRQQLLADPSS